jgi:signal transduction histidine kinase
VQERTAEIQAQYAQLEAILHSSSDGIIVTDSQGSIVRSNPVANIWLTQTLSPEDAARLKEAIQDLTSRATEKPETVLDLTGLDLELRAAPVTETKGEETTVVTIHDITYLKALDRMKSQFVSNVSHELRTPITTIKLYAALMQKSPREKWTEYLDILAQEADRQARLVEDILQISRIETGRLEITPRPTPLNKLTESVFVSQQPLAQERKLTIKYNPADPGPEALVDPDRMTQVLTNLVTNAIQYTPRGGNITISTGEKEMDGHTLATITVADTGMGIDEEELPHIFERFFRGEQPRSMQVPGTGLGLAIVKDIVELHGGQVTVKSEMNIGTSFTIWLPRVNNRFQ